MDSVFVAMGAELLQFNAASRVSTVFLGRVPRHASGTLIRIGPALRTFQRDDDADAFSHGDGYS